MKTLAILVLVVMIVFWLSVLYWASIPFMKQPEPEHPMRDWSKRPVCVVNGRPEFCKSPTLPRR